MLLLQPFQRVQNSKSFLICEPQWPTILSSVPCPLHFEGHFAGYAFEIWNSKYSKNIFLFLYAPAMQLKFFNYFILTECHSHVSGNSVLVFRVVFCSRRESSPSFSALCKTTFDRVFSFDSGLTFFLKNFFRDLRPPIRPCNTFLIMIFKERQNKGQHYGKLVEGKITDLFSDVRTKYSNYFQKIFNPVNLRKRKKVLQPTSYYKQKFPHKENFLRCSGRHSLKSRPETRDPLTLRPRNLGH